MAYIVNTTQTVEATSGTSYAVTLGAHQTGDLLLVFLTQQTGATSIAPGATAATAGWSILVQERGSTTVRHAVAWVVATSNAMANPTFTGSNNAWLGACLVVRDAHASPFGSLVDGTDFNSTGYAGATSFTTGALTTAVNECLVLYSFGAASDSSTVYSARYKVNDVRGLSNQRITACNQFIGYQQQQTAGAIAQPVFYGPTNPAATGIVLAVRNVTNGALQPDVRPSVTEAQWYGAIGAVHDATTTWQDPQGATTTPFGTSIGGITLSTTSPTVSTSLSNLSSVDAANYGSFTSLASTESTAGAWVGGTHTIASVDMSGAVVSITMTQSQSSVASTSGAQGHIICFSDGTNWAAYQLTTKVTAWGASIPWTSFIAVGSSTAYASSGSINWAAVTRVAYFSHRVGSSTSSSQIWIKNLAVHYGCSLTGGGSGRPSTFVDYVSGLGGWKPYFWSQLQGSAQVLGKANLQIGDGTNTTYFDASASSFEFPQGFATNDATKLSWNATSGAVSLKVKAGASDIINLAAGVAATDVQQNLTIDAASSASAAYSFAGTSFVGWSPTWKTGVNVSSATFSECAEIDAKGSDWTDTTIKKTTSTDAAIAFSEDGGSMTRCTIDITGTSAAYHLELGTAVTAITLDDVTFTGTPTTDKIHVKKTTGTVTITTSGTTSIVAGDVTSDGATVSIVAPTVERGIAFTGLQTGTSIQVFTSGTQTKIYGDNSTAGSTFSFDDATVGSITVDYTIQKAGYLPQRVTGQVLTGSVGGQLDVAVTQLVDRAYSASSGLTYGTTAVVTVGANPTTAPGTKTFTLSTASTVQNWYSFWIEQWIDLGNATGEALANVEFPLSANGPNSFTLNDGWTFSNGATSIAFLSRDGLRYLNTSDVLQKAWAAILTAGVPSGARVRYQQSDAGTTSNAVVSSGNMDELVQIYDVGVFDYRGYLVLKVQEMGYDQAEANVVTTYGNLEDQLYVVGLTPTANGVATGDPSLATAPTISQGTYVVDGKTFSVKIVDGATANTGTGIMRWLRYNFETGGSFQSEDAFNWHDLVRTNGTKFKTVNGTVYGTATTKGVLVYQNDGTTLHPDFDLFTADNGTTYAPPPAATVSLSGLTSGSRVQLYDTTNSLELYNAVVGATTLVYSETYSVNRAIRLRVSYVSGTSAKAFIEASIGSITSGSPDVAYIVSQTNDTTYNSNGINGPSVYATSGITFTDAATDRVNCNIAGGSVTYPTIYACFVYWNFTATGIANDFTYIDAPDTANYLLSGMKIRNTSVTDLMVTGGYGRDATSGLSKDIIDTAGSTGNIFLAPDHVVPYQTTGTYAITGDISTVIAAIPSTTEIWAEPKALTVGKFLGLK
jgi:hypothetical protein